MTGPFCSTDLGEEKDETGKKEGWNNLDRKRYTPLSAVTATIPGKVAPISNPASHNLTKSIEQLLQAGDLAADASMRDLGLIDGYDHRQGADSETSDQSSSVEHTDSDSRRLDDTADGKDTACDEDDHTASDVSSVPSTSSTDEAASCEQSDDGA